MGTWGSGNFDSDDALDILETIAEVTDPEIEGFLQSPRVGIEDLAAILACIAIENALVQHCGLPPRERESASQLKEKILAIYADEAEGFFENPEFLARRKTEIENTIETMMAAMREND